MRRLAGLALVCLLLAGCTERDRSSQPPPPSPTTGAATTSPGPPAADAVPCGDYIAHLPGPSAGMVSVLSIVALPIGRTLGSSDQGDGWRYAKQGLEVFAGAVVELTVDAPAAGHARIGWGSPARPGRTQRVDGCTLPGCTGDCGWLAFAGGYWVDAPACVPIVVRSGGRVARVRIAVGTPCD